MAIKLKNNAVSTISAITATDTTITVGGGDGAKFPSISSGDWYYVTLTNSLDDTSYEIVKVTDITSDTLTVERGAEGTVAKAFSDGDIIEQRATAQTLYDLTASNAPTETFSRQYLDELPCSRKDDAIFTESQLLPTGKKFCPELINNWDSKYGSRVKCQIVDSTNGTVLEDNIQFLTISDIATWVSNNLDDGSGNATVSSVIKVFDELSPEIITPTKSYGLNRFYSASKAGYMQTKSTVTYSNLSASIFGDMFNYAFAPAGISITASSFNKKACWVSNAKKNKYTTLHKLAEIRMVNTGGGSNRSYYDNKASDYGDLTAGEENFIIDTSGVTFIAKLDSGVNLEMNNLSNVAPNVGEEGSRVIVYPLKGITNEHRKAIMIKPIGVDSIVMDYPPFSDYELEIIAQNNTMQSNILSKIVTQESDLSHSMFDKVGSKMRLELSDISDIYGGRVSTREGSTYSTNNKYNVIRFRYRRKSDGVVGQLSNFGIVYENYHKIGTFRFMIKRFD